MDLNFIYGDRIIVRPYDLEQIEYYYKKIIECLDKRDDKNLPQYVRGYFSCLVTTDELAQKAYKSCEYIINKFEKDPYYKLKFQSVSINRRDRKMVIKMNLRLVISECMLSFIYYKIDNPECTASQSVKFFYNALSTYSAIPKRNLSDYKKKVIAGFLAQAAGCKIYPSEIIKNSQMERIVERILKRKVI